jgi:hypothetical protein
MVKKNNIENKRKKIINELKDIRNSNHTKWEETIINNNENHIIKSINEIISDNSNIINNNENHIIKSINEIISDNSNIINNSVLDNNNNQDNPINFTLDNKDINSSINFTLDNKDINSSINYALDNFNTHDSPISYNIDSPINFSLDNNKNINSFISHTLDSPINYNHDSPREIDKIENYVDIFKDNILIPKKKNFKRNSLPNFGYKH